MSTQRPRVLVTGSHGFLGSLFVRYLEEQGIPYARYDSKAETPLPADIEAVVHFAGLVPHRAAGAGIRAYEKANVEGTKRLLAALEGLPLRRFVNIGTAAEYGFAKEPLTEQAPEKPANAYGASKLAQSTLLAEFAAARGVSVVNLRVFNIIGLPARGGARAPSIFDALIAQFDAGGKGVLTVSHAESVRDYIDTEDLMRAIHAALTAELTNSYELINIASGHGTSIREIAALLGGLLDKPYRLKNIERTPTNSRADISKARRLLRWKPRISLAESIKKIVGARRRILIVGAGEAARQALTEIIRAGRTDLAVCGLVDDDPRKQGKRVGESRVVGTIADLPQLVRDLQVNEVMICAPSAGPSIAARVAGLLPAGFPIRVVPSLSSILLDKVRLSLVRPLDLADLVGRPIVKADQTYVAKHAKGKTFLVTGAAGSIGSEIVRQLMSFPAARVVAVDSWEEGIFNLTEEWQAARGPQFVARIANVRDTRRMEEIVRTYRPDAILHAAAYKHVPLMEENPQEAQKTNVGGTRTMLALAAKYKVASFLLISTDKAVHPASVMGRSKRAAELLVKKYARKYPRRRFMAVRFGNVLNSSGSAIPKFIRQIEARQPLTITHRDMTRYFMSIPEAVSLVLMAGVVGENGQVLVLDMGEPVRIMDLAVHLIKMHGLTPGTDIPIVEVGMRAGEKLHEELAYARGALTPSPAARIFIAESL